MEKPQELFVPSAISARIPQKSTRDSCGKPADAFLSGSFTHVVAFDLSARAHALFCFRRILVGGTSALLGVRFSLWPKEFAPIQLASIPNHCTTAKDATTRMISALVPNPESPTSPIALARDLWVRTSAHVHDCAPDAVSSQNL
jgi:hypothetical protein